MYDVTGQHVTKFQKIRYCLIRKIAMGDGIIINCDMYEPWSKPISGKGMVSYNRVHSRAQPSGRGAPEDTPNAR